MAFDEILAARILAALARKKNVEEKKMFGGIGFLLNGNMLVGVWMDSLIVRFDPDEGNEALLDPHVKKLDITGRSMKGWVWPASQHPGQDARGHAALAVEMYLGLDKQP